MRDRGQLNHARGLPDLAIADGYSSGEDLLLDDFYVPAMSASIRYDRAVGYFSSSLLALAPLAFADFVEQGGRIRLVTSPYLSPLDRARLGRAETAPQPTRDDLVDELKILAQSDDLAGALTRVMSSLIASEVLTLKFARPTFGDGLYHDKIGIFADRAGNEMSFVGSANETAAAWSGMVNHEQIETFVSWKDPEQQSRVERHARQFRELWSGVRRGVEVSSATAAAALVRETSAPTNPDEALQLLREALESRRRGKAGPKRTLRPHQVSVLESWERAGKRGIVVFATGGGKTLVAIEAIRRWTAQNKPAIVAVPSTLLHRQWLSEIRSELPDIPVLQCGAKADKGTWLGSLATFTDGDPELGPRITLTTYATAVSDDFMARVRGGDHVLVVADEVHRVGAPDSRRFLSLEAGGRLGLSATPERYGDPAGTDAIFDYFGQPLDPRFGIREAIDAKQLVPYDYLVETVELSPDEQDKWVDLSRRMAQQYARSDGVRDDRFDYLARERARILKGASAKTDKALEVLDALQHSGDRWLVYCESKKHLRSVRETIEHRGRRVLEYHSDTTGVGDEIFELFEMGGVLLAIKCLDEGVDLPFINKALILASTTNPREYIQRRGRVLRTSDDKHSALIVDVLVVDGDGLPLAVSEARRALEFATHARNISGRVELESMLARMDDVDIAFEEAADRESDDVDE